MKTWIMTYHLNSDEYTPLQIGSTVAELTNETDNKLLITRVLLIFDWLRDKRYSRDCNIEVKPGETAKLPSVFFRIGVDAPTGTRHYRPGIAHKELIDRDWIYQGEKYVQTGKHVIIKEAATRDYKIFISHSNNKNDEGLLSMCENALNKCGITPYVAERRPRPGYPLWEKIRQAIKQSDAIFVLWTPWGATSGDVREEIGIAVGSGKRRKIIPIVGTEEKDVHGSLEGLEFVPLDPSDTMPAISQAISIAIEWAEKKEKARPRAQIKVVEKEGE